MRIGEIVNDRSLNLEKFQGVEELGVVTGEPARSLAEELKKMKLRSHLPSAPRAKLVQSLSLQSDENQLLFKMSWEELGEDERQNVQVRIEPSGVAGKVPAGTLKDLIRIAQPNQAEQGESPSVP